MVCGYLDVKALGRLEICGRHSGRTARLEHEGRRLSSRHSHGSVDEAIFARPDARPGAAAAVARWQKSIRVPTRPWRPVSFDEFAFTIAVSWIEPGKSERSFAEFPFMRLISESVDDVN